jgi:hypothetical protein
MNKNGTPNFGRLPLWKLSAIGLVIAAAMVISACEAITNGDTGAAGSSNALSLAASRTGVGAVIPITDEDELAAIGNDPDYPLNGDYQLGADLDLTDWIPIGYDPTVPTVVNPFIGQFDGAGYTIKVSDFDDDVLAGSTYIGIFAKIGDGTSYYPPVSVSNLTVDIATGPINPESAQYVGGLAGYTDTAVFTNITVTGSLDVGETITPLDPPDYRNLDVGGVAGYALSSSFTNVSVSETLNAAFDVPASYVPKPEIWKGDGIFRARYAVTETGSNSLTAGGVAGFAKYSQFRSVVSSVNVTAQSKTVTVYAGGILGYGDGDNIDDSQANIRNITVNGFGYNTSGGGVAGYIINSRINYASASGPVTVSSRSATFGWDDSWQVYAGGLVGYAGGSDAGPSLIDHSHASGTIRADSPFPYAGGLVGYLYGYNDFSSPAKNGSTVSRSYATGNVTAVSDDDPSGAVGDVPYAGGLVGYASVTGSTIVDSYARGNATATTNGTFAWAGGVVGGNANDAVVLRTYATGDITSTTGSLSPLYAPDYAPAGPAAGGIAGFDYYTSKTKVEDSVALNRTINGNNSAGQDVVHRVVGSVGDGTGHDGILEDNLANVNMVVGVNWKPEYGPDRRDGADTAAVPATSVFTNLGWDFSKVWTTGSDGYPILQ